MLFLTYFISSIVVAITFKIINDKINNPGYWAIIIPIFIGQLFYSALKNYFEIENDNILFYF